MQIELHKVVITSKRVSFGSFIYPLKLQSGGNFIIQRRHCRRSAHFPFQKLLEITEAGSAEGKAYFWFARALSSTRVSIHSLECYNLNVVTKAVLKESLPYL